jgi:anaerobic selenocysteine-containing dehydrogenase
VEGGDEVKAALEEEPFVEVHPEDARSLGLEDGHVVRVETPAGAAELPLRVTAAVARGSAFVPYNQPGLAANTLMSGAFHTTARITATGSGPAGTGDGETAADPGSAREGIGV